MDSRFLDFLVISYGVQLSSSWVNTMLYMLELVLCWQYFQRSSRPLIHKIGVGAMVFFDTLCTMAICGALFLTYLQTVGRATFTATLFPVSATIITTYASASIEQLFLCHLYFILTRNKVISILLVLLVLLHTAFSWAAGIMLMHGRIAFSLTSRITAVGAISCAVTDIFIAGCLGYQFFGMQPDGPRISGKSVIRRFYILSLTSGVIVATTTLLMMILFLKGSVAFEFFFYLQGRVYAVTLLGNFLTSPANGPRSNSAGISEKLVSTVAFRTYSQPGVTDGSVKRPAPSVFSTYVRH
ncbi:hypothetical protein C8J57DRAFT_251439 [Mycena rebaudengoi]|nr:hypothetical protein C8J57DRAFT_251439 [Mycena rebaudengoi]